MKNKISKSRIAVLVLFVFILASGCSNNEKKKEVSSTPAAGSTQIKNPAPATLASSIAPAAGSNRIKNPAPAPLASDTAPAVKVQQSETNDIAVSVDGKILKKSELESNLKERMKMLKDKIPAGKQKEFQEEVKKKLVDAFVIRTIANNEF
ncbi:MAG: hypothetical protein ABSC11_14675, partial [Smithella sp.]